MFSKGLIRAFTRVLLIIAVFSLLAFLRGCALRPATNFSGSHFNHGNNAVWLSIEWVKDAHTPAEVAALAGDLARRQIRYVFAYTTYLRIDTADFNPTYAHAAEFVQAFKQAQPDLKVLAWIGLPMPSMGGAADLHDPAIRQKITTISAQFVNEMGFDGVHIDPEHVSSGDQDVITLLDEMRPALVPGAILSIAAEKIQPVFPDQPFLNGNFIGWSGKYYRQVARHVNQIAVMTYDTGIHQGWLYRELLRFEVIGISQAINGSSVELLFGVPDSEEASLTHDPQTETIINGIQGIIDGLNDLDAVPEAVSGIAIYPEWETDAAKWTIYQSQWLAAPTR